MANELDRRSPRNSGLAHTQGPGRGADITQQQWGGTALVWSDQPTTFPTSTALVPATPHTGDTTPAQPQAPLAAMVRQHPKPFRLRSGEVVQRRTGWSAWPDKIVHVTIERPLAPTTTGSYAPSGPWALVRRITHQATARAERNNGKVPADTTNATADAKGTQPDPTPSNDRFRDGSNALAHLPASVRRSLLTRVPEPTVFDGRSIRHSINDEPTSFEVTVLRQAGRHATVAVATRPATEGTWDVTMLTYTFAQPPQTESTRP